MRIEQYNRPFYEHFSPMLQVTEGCTHHKCRFCSFFPETKFALAPMEEILADIDDIARECTTLEKRRIFLTGGNAISLPPSKLLPILDAIHERIPEVKEIGGYCRVADIKRRSDEDLAELAKRGVNMITIGAEGGWDPALEFVNKGHTGADVAEQGQRLHKAGIKFSYFYLAGMAGSGKGQENAVASAAAYNLAAPDYTLVMSITPTKTWALREDIENGLWVPPTELEMAQEIRTFVENLTCKTILNSSHDTNIIRFDASLPQDKEKALALLDDRIAKMNPAAARRMREYLFGATL